MDHSTRESPPGSQVSANQINTNLNQIVSFFNPDKETSDVIESLEVEDQGGDRSDFNQSFIGLQKENIDDIYDLYVQHAREVGFSVRKTTTRSNALGVVFEKYYVCSCEGYYKPNLRDGDKKRRTYITRTGCSASLRVKINDDGLYEVVDHNTTHNHTLTRKEWSHLHRSQRSISGEKAIIIEDMISSGMKASDSFRYMAKDAGGVESVGHTLKDHLNFVNRLKMKSIEGGDAQTLMDMLYQKGVDDQEFFFRVKLDDDGRLSNVYWRDSMMKEDFRIYGDVVVFDTTYRTNKYNLICAPFVGLNNHKKNVMFGCAFISNEKIESFLWLFDVFKKSMEGQSPVTLFTDQDLAITNAIGKVFPDTRHRLCLWHLYQNAISRFGKLRKNKSFKDAFNNCLSGCTNPDEFENFWKLMIKTYNLEDNSWFERLYLLKEKWCTGLSKNFFSAGILSSQRSESTNSAIELKAKKTTSLTEFYGIFSATVQRWRDNEKLDEFQCSRAKPTSILSISGIMKHASEVYTLTLFKDFEKEILKSVSTTCRKMNEDDYGTILYNLIHDDSNTSYDVIYYEMNKLIACSCKRFEECGLLCCHCLRVFQIHSVKEIPQFYIKKRWTKFAKEHLWDKDKSGIHQSHNPNDQIPWRQKMVRKYYNLIQKAEEDEASKQIIEDGYDRDVCAIEALTMVVQPIEKESVVSSSFIDVLDPTRSVTKGRRKRVKGHLQKNKKKKKNMKSKDASDTNQPKEFGTQTPNPRLF